MPCVAARDSTPLGHLQARLVYYLMNIHTQPRAIYLCRVSLWTINLKKKSNYVQTVHFHSMERVFVTFLAELVEMLTYQKEDRRYNTDIQCACLLLLRVVLKGLCKDEVEEYNVVCCKKKKKYDPARIRTWNPLIRSQMPYPLGHRAGCV